MVSSDALVSAWDHLTGAVAATAIGVVSVFMVVGGVVIMNIMLAVVTERTREIGIRKSVGARRNDILNQFLVESSLLAGVGGLLGVLLAWSMALLVRNLTPVPMLVPWLGGIHRRHACRPASVCSLESTQRSGQPSSIPLKRSGRNMKTTPILAHHRTGLRTVWEHKLRSFLTVLGVIIGTGAIIGVGSIIAGLDSSITNVLRSFGTNTVIAFKFPLGFTTHLSSEEIHRKPLTVDDARAIAERCADVEHVTMYLFPNTFGTGPNVIVARYRGNDLFNIDLGRHGRSLRHQRPGGDEGGSLFYR